MLRALELIGFKSFADKTRFQFPPGVTAIVGPNGSGKSNIVDAIKWVLGAQSVKSLRGKEMADVIFNGSGARRAINTAEVTLTLDNEDGLLTVGTPEVQITRRVYRSGEGEYLINHQPSRLRDIKELFAGTGVATEAYSVIEQGKVDVMLQASPRDRRIIFEEAAGISRFKAKKLESERRLARVEQNLLRLSDIVDEVDNRLRTVRSQASKARRYREHTERLQELRTQVAVADWRSFTRSLDTLEAEITERTGARDRLLDALEAGEKRAIELDQEDFVAEERIRAVEGRLAETHRQIAEIESTRTHQVARQEELDEEIARHRRQLVAMSVRAGGDFQRAREAETSLTKAEEEEADHAHALRREESVLRENATRLAELERKSAARRSEHMDTMRAAASLGSQISILKSQFSSASAAQARCQAQLASLGAEARELSASLGESEARLDRLTAEADQCGKKLRAVRRELSDTRRRLTKAHKETAALAGSRTGALQRAEFLEELERRLEGVGAGAREVLLKARLEPEGPFGEVRGLVADLLHVSVDIAPLVEVALGDNAHSVVLASSGGLLSALNDSAQLLTGRVQFLRLDVQLATTALDRVDLSARSGVVDRLDRLVETGPEFVPLLRRLLGRTWLVDDLPTAVQLSDGPGRGLDFVTQDGQRLGADGTLITGPKHAATGLLSRRSELRSLRDEIERLDGQLIEREREVAELEANAVKLDTRVEALAPKHAELTGTLSEQRLKTVSLRDRLEQIEGQQSTLTTERQAAQTQADSAGAELVESERELHAVDNSLANLEADIENDSQAVEANRVLVAEHQLKATERRVALATSQQRLEVLRSQIDQLRRDQAERSAALDDVRRRLTERCGQNAETQARLLQCTGRLAELYLLADRRSAEIVEQVDVRQHVRDEREHQNTDLHRQRQELQRCERRLQKKQLSAAQITQQRQALVERLRDDYGINLDAAGSDAAIIATEADDAVEDEIQDLRRKIDNIGAVNLQALEELNELEERSGTLSTQFQDLAKAKASLEQIIGRINADSRRMFAATLEMVRGHFQELFRRLFGGGEADIVLAGGDDADVLDSGIEIVARPPGKDPRSISLLSGGEKTLTCVALLLAIFRGRPSPFCVLDEVDAALDEANIERFTAVLSEFLTSTQFIVITHSKKTMTHADTLYGVTMQESGISKQVSVRFEDVSDDGTIRPAAVEAVVESPPKDDETQAA